MKRVMRVWLAASLGMATLAGCRDTGLPDRNLPLDQARHRTYGYAAYQPLADNEPIAVAGRHWMGSLPVQTIPDRMLVQVGGSERTQLYALRGQEAPYSILYSPLGQDRWRPFLRID